MYSTCLFCNQSLGANTVVEQFPVGRRLAFDAAKGRLWVVCRRCERWNLSPIEERWEAIDGLERLFRDTRMRVSTENIGLARHPEGLELVRIGSPQRPEFAAWRYGDQFGRRRKRAILYGVGAGVVFGGVVIGGTIAGVIGSSLLAQSGNFVNLWVNGRTRLKLPTADGRVHKLKLPDLQKARLRPAGNDPQDLELVLGRKSGDLVFTGPDAERVAGLIMPKLNASGARESAVRDAVRALEEAGGPEPYLRSIAQGAYTPSQRYGYRSSRRLQPGTLGKLAVPTRLALEMSLHEEQERRALEGELKALELAWKAAEEVAAISDDLLLSEETRAFLNRHRRENPTEAGAGPARGIIDAND